MRGPTAVPWADQRPYWFRRLQRLLVWPGRLVWAIVGGYILDLPFPTLWGATPTEIGLALKNGYAKTLRVTCHGSAPWIERGSNRLYFRAGLARTVTQLSSPPLQPADLTVVGYEPVNPMVGRLVAQGARGERIVARGSVSDLAILEAFLDGQGSEAR